MKSDVPSRRPHARNGFVRARIGASQYLVDFGGEEPQFSFYSGARLLDIGERVQANWLAEAGVWLIEEIQVLAGVETYLVWGTIGEDPLWIQGVSAGGVLEPNVTVPTGPFVQVGAEFGALRFSPDGNWIAAMGEFFPTDSTILSVWPFSGGVAGPGTSITVANDRVIHRGALRWSPDSRWIAVPLLGDFVHIFEWTGGAFGTIVTGPPPSLPASSPGPHNVNWSPDGNYIAFPSENNDALMDVYEWTGSGFGPRVVDPATAPDVGNLTASNGVDIGWRPQGDVIVLQSDNGGLGSNDRQIHAWEWTGSGFGAQFPYHDEADSIQGVPFDGSSLAWTEDGRWVVVCDSNDAIRVYEYINSSTALTLRSSIGFPFGEPSEPQPSVPPQIHGNQAAWDYLNGDFIVTIDVSPRLSDGNYYVAATYSWNLWAAEATGFPLKELYLAEGPHGMELYPFDGNTGVIDIGAIVRNREVPTDATDPFDTSGFVNFWPFVNPPGSVESSTESLSAEEVPFTASNEGDW